MQHPAHDPEAKLEPHHTSSALVPRIIQKSTPPLQKIGLTEFFLPASSQVLSLVCQPQTRDDVIVTPLKPLEFTSPQPQPEFTSSHSHITSPKPS